MTALDDFCFSQPGLLLIPPESLTREGIRPAFADAVAQREWPGRTTIDAAWIETFNLAFRRYWERTAALAAASPGDWLPPRLQHVAVVTQPAKVRPYFQPIHAASWLVYASDFDPQASNAEFGAFCLVQAERLGITRDIVVATVQNLSYWLHQDSGVLSRFQDACRTARRPDASAFSALGDALAWVCQLHHRHLRAPTDEQLSRLSELPRTHLLLTREEHQRVEGLLSQWVKAGQAVAAQHFARFDKPGAEAVQRVLAYLKKRTPQLIVTDRDERVLWSPQRPRTGKLKEALAGLSDAAADSMLKDFDVINRKSREFLNRVRDPQQLPDVHAESAAPGGLSYMHQHAKRIAYNIHEAEPQRLREPAPAFERLMLGARTVHEWCHLAVDGGWVRKSGPGVAAYDRAMDALAGLHAEILQGLPVAQAEPIRTSLQKVSMQPDRPELALVAIPAERMTDFLANMLGQRFMSHAEIQTYVRNNVRSLAFDHQTTGLLSRLARYAFEYQYLRFAQLEDPMDYLLSTTWLPQQYFESGIVSESTFAQLCTLTGHLCDAYDVDETYFI